MKVRVDITAMLATYIVLFCNAGVLGFIKGSFLISLSAYGAVFLWLVCVFVKDKRYVNIFVSTTFPIILFCLFLAISSFFTTGQIKITTDNMVKNILFVLIFYIMYIYYCDKMRKTGRRFILACWFIDIIVSCIYTNYRLIENPLLSRILAVGNRSVYIDSSVSVAGVLGYGGIYGLVLIIISLYWVTKKNKSTRKILIFLITLLLSYTVVQAQFFIAFVIVILGIIINLIWEENNIRKRYIHLILTIPCLMIGVVVIVNVLPDIIRSGVLPDMIGNRLSLFYNQSSIANLLYENRGWVYLKSINTIGNTFGLGTIFFNNQTSGGHSEILDMIANYGIVFSSLFLCGMRKMERFISKTIPEDSIRNHNIVWAMFIIMSFLNPSLWCPTTICLFLIIPLIYIETDQSCNKETCFENCIN